jgi:hypothetical protein
MPDRWKKLEAFFHEAPALRGEARAAHLAKACDGDEQLRAEAASSRTGSSAGSAEGGDVAVAAQDGAGALIRGQGIQDNAITVSVGDGSLSGGAFPVQSIAPGLFSANANGHGLVVNSVRINLKLRKRPDSCCERQKVTAKGTTEAAVITCIKDLIDDQLLFKSIS